MKRSLYLSSVLIILFAFSCNAHLSNEDCTEVIKNDCICTKEYRPVCGCNNKTYGNACEAGCAGITRFTEGACKR